MQVYLKSDKNNEDFTWTHMYIYVNIILNSSYNEKYVWQNCRENQNTFYVQ